MERLTKDKKLYLKRTICNIIEHVAWNQSGLLLTNIFQNTQTLQLFTKMTKTESIYKSNWDAKAEEGLVDET